MCVYNIELLKLNNFNIYNPTHPIKQILGMSHRLYKNLSISPLYLLQLSVSKYI